MSWLSKNWKAFLLLILPAMLVYMVWRKYQLEHYARYTIGTTLRRLLTTKSGFQIQYTFYINGKEYTGERFDYKQYHIQFPGSRYFVKYSYKFPSQSEIQWNLPVPDSIKNAPSDGWTALPQSK